MINFASFFNSVFGSTFEKTKKCVFNRSRVEYFGRRKSRYLENCTHSTNQIHNNNTYIIPIQPNIRITTKFVNQWVGGDWFSFIIYRSPKIFFMLWGNIERLIGVKLINIYNAAFPHYWGKLYQSPPTHWFTNFVVILIFGWYYYVCIIMYYVSDRCCGHSFWDSDFSFGQNTPLGVY